MFQLHASSEVEVLNERACRNNDLGQGLSRNLLIKLGSVTSGPKLPIIAHVVELLADPRCAHELLGAKK